MHRAPVPKLREGEGRRGGVLHTVEGDLLSNGIAMAKMSLPLVLAPGPCQVTLFWSPTFSNLKSSEGSLVCHTPHGVQISTQPGLQHGVCDRLSSRKKASVWHVVLWYGRVSTCQPDILILQTLDIPSGSPSSIAGMANLSLNLGAALPF